MRFQKGFDTKAIIFFGSGFDVWIVLTLLLVIGQSIPPRHFPTGNRRMHCGTLPFLLVKVAQTQLGNTDTVGFERFPNELAAHPDYSAAYFHGGQTLERLGHSAEARDLYQRGIEATTRKGDFHTRDEIQAALDLMS